MLYVLCIVEGYELHVQTERSPPVDYVAIDSSVTDLQQQRSDWSYVSCWIQDELFIYPTLTKTFACLAIVPDQS